MLLNIPILLILFHCIFSKTVSLPRLIIFKNRIVILQYLKRDRKLNFLLLLEYSERLKPTFTACRTETRNITLFVLKEEIVRSSSNFTLIAECIVKYVVQKKDLFGSWLLQCRRKSN